MKKTIVLIAMLFLSTATLVNASTASVNPVFSKNIEAKAFNVPYIFYDYGWEQVMVCGPGPYCTAQPQYFEYTYSCTSIPFTITYLGKRRIGAPAPPTT